MNNLFVMLLSLWPFAVTFNPTTFVGQGPILKPLGAEVLLFELKFPEEGGLKYRQHCVYYRIPFKKLKGQLSITENKTDVRCPEEKMISSSLVLSIEAISSLFVSFEEDQLKVDFIAEKMGNIKWHFPLINLSKMIGAKAKILRFSEESFSKTKSPYWKTRIQCLKVDKEGAVVGENLCSRCAYGAYEVVDYTSQLKNSFFCGPNFCGKKNEPACIRGGKTQNPEEDGICEENLTVVKSAENILLCQ